MLATYSKTWKFYILGTGDINSTGSDTGAFCCLNVPLQDGLRDETFSKILTRYMHVSKFLIVYF